MTADAMNVTQPKHFVPGQRPIPEHSHAHSFTLPLTVTIVTQR